MRTSNKFVFLSLLVSLFFSCTQEITPEILGNKVFEAFQKKDVDMALGYILYEDDYRDFFSNAKISESEKERLINKHTSTDYIAKMVKRFKRRFTEIIEEGEAAGIAWSKTKFEYIEGPNDDTFMGLQADEIYVFFSYESTTYKLRLDDCYKSSRGWLMSDEPSFEGEVIQ